VPRYSSVPSREQGEGVQKDERAPQDDVIQQARRHAALVREHVEQALDLAEEQGGPFDFTSLAIAAHCSVAYLRKHREFATRIRALQATVPEDPQDPVREDLMRRLARAEHRAAELSGRVERLDAENTRLRARLAQLGGRAVPVGRRTGGMV
jgi:hypothetical protein